MSERRTPRGDACPPPGTRVEVRVLDRRAYLGDWTYPRAVVAVQTWAPGGYRWIHLHRPVTYHPGRGLPAWLLRAAAAVRGLVDGGRSLDQLGRVVEAHARGRRPDWPTLARLAARPGPALEAL